MAGPLGNRLQGRSKGIGVLMSRCVGFDGPNQSPHTDRMDEGDGK